MNAPRFVAMEEYASRLIEALVVEGAILDDRMVVRHATAGFIARYASGGDPEGPGGGGPVGLTIGSLASSGAACTAIALLGWREDTPSAGGAPGHAAGAEAGKDTSGQSDAEHGSNRFRYIGPASFIPDGARPIGAAADAVAHWTASTQGDGSDTAARHAPDEDVSNHGVPNCDAGKPDTGHENSLAGETCVAHSISAELMRADTPASPGATSYPPDAATGIAAFAASAARNRRNRATNVTAGPAVAVPFVEFQMDRPAMSVRLSPLLAPGGAPFGFLLQELPEKTASTSPGLLSGHATSPDPGSHDLAGTLGRVAAKEKVAARDVLDRLFHASWEIDLTTESRVVSASWREMRGIADGALDAKGLHEWRKRVHPDDRGALIEHLGKLRAGDADFVPVIYRERHADGSWITILAKGAVIERSADGTPVRLAGTDVDVSASRASEIHGRQMAQLEQRWLVASEYGKLGLWDNDTVAGTRHVSQTWRQMRGYGPDDDFDDCLAAIYERTHPKDLAALQMQVNDTVNDGTDDVFQEYRERHRDGHYIWILTRGRVIARDASGVATRIIGIDTDITEIKEASERLSRMSRRLEVAIEATQVGVWEVDLSTGNTVWDARMIEMYGVECDPGAIPPMTWEDAIHPDDRERVLAATAAVESGEEAFSGDYRVLRPDGQIRHVRARSTQIFEDGGGKGLVGVDWDVTADVEAAEELRHAHALARERNDELELARAEMEYNALHDALTDLPNRRFLDRKLREVREDGQQIAVMHLDLDRFKQINDTLGHAAGDAVLRHVAEAVTAIAPEAATVARVGGDEFVVFFDLAPPREVLARIAEMIVSQLKSPFEVTGQPCRFGVSIGVATGTVPDQTPDEVLENADLALYEAKDGGRGCAAFFSDRMRTAAERKRTLADAILGGLDRQEFFCVYQPQFEAGSLRLSGVEALVRWRRPDGCIEAPGEFLGVAEELNVVDRIDQVVLTQVMADQARWEGLGLAVPRVAVNVSARRLADPVLPDLLGRLNIGAGRIAFELLETVFLDAPNPVIAANIATIRELGIEIEIDDFGTGHASIVGMLRLQPDRLKIDQQLVGPLIEGEKQGILVRSIIDIGRMHGIDLIAEGVETSEHVRLLTAMGCHYLQGFGLGVPMSEAELRMRLRTGRWDMTAAA